MKKVDENDREIDNILNSLEGMVRAEAPPFFYTRLQARLQRQGSGGFMQKLFGFFAQPTFAIATLSLFVLLNVLAIGSIGKTKSMDYPKQFAKEGTIQNFAQEYDLSVSSIYTDNQNNR